MAHNDDDDGETGGGGVYRYGGDRNGKLPHDLLTTAC